MILYIYPENNNEIINSPMLLEADYTGFIESEDRWADWVTNDPNYFTVEVSDDLKNSYENIPYYGQLFYWNDGEIIEERFINGKTHDYLDWCKKKVEESDHLVQDSLEDLLIGNAIMPMTVRDDGDVNGLRETLLERASYRNDIKIVNELLENR